MEGEPPRARRTARHHVEQPVHDPDNDSGDFRLRPRDRITRREGDALERKRGEGAKDRRFQTKNPAVAFKEDEYETHHRWTAMTHCLSELGPGEIPGCELLFNGGIGVQKTVSTVLEDLRACGVQVEWLTVPMSDSGSYRTEHLLEYMEKHLLDWEPDRKWRVLMLDAAKSYLDPAVARLAWRKGYVVIQQGGGCTSVSRVNDTDLHHTISSEYQELEMMEAIALAEVDSSRLAERSRESCIRDWCTVWKRFGLHAFAAQGFKRRGLSNNLDGSEDSLVSGQAGECFHWIGMPEKRAIIVADIREGVRSGDIQCSFESVYDIITPFPRRGQLDVFYDAHENHLPLEAGEAAHSDREDVSDEGDAYDGPVDASASVPVEDGSAAGVIATALRAQCADAALPPGLPNVCYFRYV